MNRISEKKHNTLRLFCMPALAGLCVSVWPSAWSWADIRFNRDIRGILADNCFACHGPDSSKRQADLRLDVRDAAIRKNESGQATIVPGRPSESLLVQRIEAIDTDSIMPPVEFHKTLSSDQKSLIKQWIAEGAPYESHWAFVPLGIQPPPQVRQTSWVLNPIDRFILARLEQQGLTPSPSATKETLIRRVAFDLTGLPPTLAEVESYILDDSRFAYETMVDHFLQSQHYGERMAVDWLDAARFADTNGYQVDRDREVYAWRDWVIAAFNRNLPFDQFTIEQLAGDLLPNATVDQKIATGFHRNHMMNEEGGVLPEEFLAEYLADRVETTAAVWLGQTLNCARCHDHKYDPFTQRDFYALKAFFNAVPEPGRGHYDRPIRESNPPFLSLPSVEQSQQLQQLNVEIESLTKQLAAMPKVTETQVSRWAQRVADQKVVWRPANIFVLTKDTTTATFSQDQSKVSLTTNGVRNLSVTLKLALPHESATVIRMKFSSRQKQTNLRLQNVNFAALANNKEAASKAIDVYPRQVGDSLAVSELAKAVDEDARSVAVLDWSKSSIWHTAFEIADTSRAIAKDGLAIELKFNGITDAFDVSVETTSDPLDLLVSDGIVDLAKKGFPNLKKEEQNTLSEYLQSQSTEYRLTSNRMQEVTAKLSELQRQIPTTLIMAEMDKPRPTHILMRGAYDKPSEEVTAETPATLPSMDPSLPKNRLGLARWLVDPQNPLTARVIVNRMWQSVFGTGLVRTSEDFGVQGEPPSHPELLDWLAVEFQHSGWNVKALLRMMLTSATYRQSSRISTDLLAKDPENRLLARGPRFRLQAEFVRDQALAASGLLASRIGGPSVKPYHPTGLYEQITAGNGTNVYVVGKGEELYRRSLYTYWKRSVPNPAMLVFDAPFRETCTLRRPRTNTPLQALNLMNDPTYIEAARCMAERMLRDGGSDLGSQISHGFRLLLSRRPSAEELQIMRNAYSRAHRDFSVDSRAAQELLAVGERPAEASLDPVALAAMTAVASTLLNLDEAITKE